MADIAKIGFEADTSDLKQAEKDLENLVPAADKAERSVKSFSQRISELGSFISSTFLGSVANARTALISFAAGLVAAFAFDNIIQGLIDIAQNIDDVSKAATKLGADMGDMQALGLAADLAGQDFSALANSATKMNKALATAIATGKGGDGVFKILGVSAQALVDMPITERFAFLADRMGELNLTAEQSALVLAKLGDRSGELFALLDGGSEGIRQASQLLEDFNGKLTTEQGKDVEAMNDAWTALTYSIEAAGNQIVAGFAPILGPIFSGLAQLIGAITGGFMFLGGIIKYVFNSMYLTAMAIFKQIDGLFKSVFGVSLTQMIKSSANFMINAWTGAYTAVGIIWDHFPAVIAAAAIGAVNLALAQINRLISGSLAALNTLYDAVSRFAGGEGGELLNSDSLNIPKIDNPYTAEANKAWSDAQAAFAANMAIDNFAASNVKSAEAVKTNTDSTVDLNDALTKTGAAAGGATEKLTALQAISKELDTIGAPFEQASSAYQKLQELQTNGIITGDQYTAMLGRIKSAFIDAGGTAEQWGKIIATKTDDMASSIKDFATKSLNSFGDTLAELAMTGKADFKALADGIIKDLIRMAIQAMIVKPILAFFGFAEGGTFGAGGGTAAFAKGGTFTNKVVTKPTTFAFANGQGFSRGLMGEKGAEAIVPLKRGPDGSLGVASHGGNGGNVNSLSVGDINIDMRGSGGNNGQDDNKDQAARVGESVKDAIRQIAVETYQSMAQYGGAANPRGGSNR